MSGNMSPHLDEFTLLRYAASDLDGQERETADDHLHVCARCEAAVGAMEELDEQLRAITGDLTRSGDLDPADPFARRPEAPLRPRAAGPARAAESLTILALEASEAAHTESGRIL